MISLSVAPNSMDEMDAFGKDGPAIFSVVGVIDVFALVTLYKLPPPVPINSFEEAVV